MTIAAYLFVVRQMRSFARVIITVYRVCVCVTTTRVVLRSVIAADGVFYFCKYV